MFAVRRVGKRGRSGMVEPPIIPLANFITGLPLNPFRLYANGLPIKEKVETPPHRANIVLFESGENKL